MGPPRRLAARGEAVAWAQGGETYCLLMAGKLVARSIVGEGATLASFETPRRQISLLTDGDNTAVTGARLACKPPALAPGDTCARRGRPP